MEKCPGGTVERIAFIQHDGDKKQEEEAQQREGRRRGRGRASRREHTPESKRGGPRLQGVGGETTDSANKWRRDPGEQRPDRSKDWQWQQTPNLEPRNLPDQIRFDVYEVEVNQEI
ncbi:hypothetical protein NDU88_008630 [Pleurodeles waltl]|uniref:Uncharacterized protein n=1 Tax=Pleurodeles waltl TaxID=8319 RepID=A0AAV7RWN4_PLEWA|nr:hypothetical protein NDU88_008630 [Pleurodeles waltl]